MNYAIVQWNRVSRRHCCPVCDHPDWCLFAGPASSPDAAICARVESHTRCGDAGWLHRLRDDWRDRPHKRRVDVRGPAEPAVDFGAMAAQWEEALDTARRRVLAAELGVTADSLSRLQVGWSECHRSYTFPMRDRAEDGTACGIRLRRPDGGKWAVRGSRNGLFVPRHFPVSESLVICEGASDTAAMLMLGFNAVGRPSCSGGVGLIVDLVQYHHFLDVMIVADRDAPGQRGARYLAARLVGYVPRGVRIVTPPTKDAREWVRSGATRTHILDAIEASPTLTLTYSRRALA